MQPLAGGLSPPLTRVAWRLRTLSFCPDDTSDTYRGADRLSCLIKEGVPLIIFVFLIFGQIAAFGVQVLRYRVRTSVYEAVRTPLPDRVGDRSQ